jgi:hypothetical protein
MKNFYAFFFECYLNEVDPVRKQRYHSLAFDRSGLMFYRGTTLYMRVNDFEEFKVPSNYNIDAHTVLSSMLWNDYSEFNKVRNDIQRQNKIATFQTLKKHDRLRLLDDYAIRTFASSARLAMTILGIALIFKLIYPQIVHESGNKVTRIIGFESINDLDIRRKLPPQPSFDDVKTPTSLLAILLKKKIQEHSYSTMSM